MQYKNNETLLYVLKKRMSCIVCILYYTVIPSQYMIKKIVKCIQCIYSKILKFINVEKKSL